MTDSLVLDIGGDVGALVIHTGADLAETEIELSPVGTTTRSHNVVHARQSSHGVAHSAVFPQLKAGKYTVWRDTLTPHGTVHITGGQVAEYRLDTAQMRSHGTAS
jgi:hypothetical protein